MIFAFRRREDEYRNGRFVIIEEPMKRGSRTGLVVGILLLAAAVAGLWIAGVFKTKPLVLKGAVITENADPRRQLPVTDAHIAIRLSSAVPPSDPATPQRDRERRGRLRA